MNTNSTNFNNFNKKDYKNLKEKYGEDFAHFCKNEFQEIAEHQSVYQLIRANFSPCRTLLTDLQQSNSTSSFINYIFSKANLKKTEITPSLEDPFTLMRKAHYTLHECKTFEEVLSFKKYFVSRESLCSFDSPIKMNSYHYFFAVKDGATLDGINGKTRDEFQPPMRENEYGTSVICIQLPKDGTTKIHICNRYNHSVPFCDATFSCDLERIYPGLTDSFARAYNIDFTYNPNTFELPNYVKLDNGTFYRYNYKINHDIYICPNNIVINKGKAYQIDQSRYELVDYFLFDKQRKVIRPITISLDDDLVRQLVNIEKIDVINVGNTREMTITMRGNKTALIILDQNNQIIYYKNDFVTKVGDNFLFFSNVKSVNLSNAKSVGDSCLTNCPNLIDANFDNATRFGDSCFNFCNSIEALSLPNATKIGDQFAGECPNLHEVYLPVATKIGDDFTNLSLKVRIINAPKVTSVGQNFASATNVLEECYMDNLKRHGRKFLASMDKKKLSCFNIGNKSTISSSITTNDPLN